MSHKPRGQVWRVIPALVLLIGIGIANGKPKVSDLIVGGFMVVAIVLFNHFCLTTEDRE